jgi:methylated-DNA-[protein]-cysteine S-methyltransferase
MKKINIHYHKTDYGELILGSYDNQLCLCDWRYRNNRDTIDNRLKKYLNASYIKKLDPVIEQAKNEISDYFAKKITLFKTPLLTLGTDFQQQVWKNLIKIPFGQTCSYLQLAEKIKKPKAVRAVANANGANAISIFIPCHRIVGHNGKLVGYAGGLEAKQALLALEAVKSSSG